MDTEEKQMQDDPGFARFGEDEGLVDIIKPEEETVKSSVRPS